MLRSTLRLIGVAALVRSLLAILPATAFAEERTCRGTIGARTMDNVRVPDGATCTLDGTTVKGTIKVETNAVLKANGVRVVGNVQGEDSRNIIVAASSRVGGSIQVVQSGRTTIVDSRVDGDVLVDENDLLQNIRRNTVGGSVQAFQNTGGVQIYRNRINGNLQCKENRPRPTGGDNVVGGNKEDQCRGF